MWSSHWLFSDKIQKVDYLHSQRCDGAYTLQFGSTGEDFETVEYELQQSTELRDIEGKRSDLIWESDHPTVGYSLGVM